MRKLSFIAILMLFVAGVFVKAGIINTNTSSEDGFTLKNMQGQTVSLSDYKGKVVYIDYWASWCMPCLIEINHAKKLKQHFEGVEDLVFLYVSIDKDEQRWKNMIAKKDIKGEHLISLEGKEDDLLERFNITSIPRFMLVNKAGKIVDYNAKPPSDERVVNDIKELL